LPLIFPESAFIPEPAPGQPSAPRRLLDLFPPQPKIGRRRPARQPATARLAPVAPTYEPFYGLAEKPFGLSTDPKFIYHSTSHDGVAQEILEALGRGDGMMVLTGEMGTGKTTLCRSLVERLGRRTVTSFITDPLASFDDLLKVVLADFGVVAREATAGGLAATGEELVAAAGDFAASLAPLQASAVIFIDEAQNMPADVLDRLSALAARSGGVRRVQVVLVGQPSLSSLLHRPECRSVERRVVSRSRLAPLTPDETMGYVAHRLAVAGPGARVEFNGAALAVLHEVTRGVPRFINLVCDRALTRGHEVAASVIDDAMIVSAAADLGLTAPAADRRWVARLALAVAFVLLVVAGAGAAAWVFRDEVSRLVTQWKGAPPPAAPVP
jgi:general secretion pathway protein A